MVSTVAIKCAKGPFNSSTWSLLSSRLGGNIFPDVSLRNFYPKISEAGNAFGFPLELKSRKTPLVLFILRQGPNSL